MSQGNPEITPESLRARVAGSFPADLGVEPLEVTDERSTGRIVVDERHLHPAGSFTAAPGSRSPTRSPPGRPSGTCRRATASPRWR